MDFFFVEYRDPLVGLIFLTILIFIVALTNYIWRLYASKDEEQKLEKFIKKFEINSSHKNLLRDSSLSLANLSFLADIFTKSGEFEKATQIYLIALEKNKDKNKQEFIFLSLAKVYFKAGFLEKSKEVLQEALKLRPRNIEALKLLKIVLLKLRSYDEILNLLECLFELNVDVKKEFEFIKALKIFSLNLNDDEKKQKILELKISENSLLGRLVFEKYKLFLGQNFLSIYDLLYTQNEVFGLENEEFVEFFYSLGKLKEFKSPVFKNSNFKMLRILRDNSFKARLYFSYSCTECKNVLPLFFYHCPVCYEFDTCKINCEVKNDEKY